MTPKQYATIIEKLGLSQRGAAAFLGVNERTSRSWIQGRSPIPLATAKLLRLMVRLDVNPEDVK